MKNMLRTYERLRRASDYAFEKNPSLKILFKSLINVNGRSLGFYYDTDIPYDYDTLEDAIKFIIPEEHQAISYIIEKEISMGLIDKQDFRIAICSELANLFEAGIEGREIEDTVYTYYGANLRLLVYDIKRGIEPILKK